MFKENVIEKAQQANFWLWSLWLVIWIVGIALRIFLAVSYPLWIDEQYSLFFSWGKSLQELMIFSQDVHPGGYYVVVKMLLHLSTNLAVLRIVSGVIPQLLGLAGITYWLMRSKKLNSAVELTFLQSFFLLNPFFIFLSTQLRMYGFVFFCTCVFIIFWQTWKKNQRNDVLFTLLFTMILGSLFSYAFFFLTGGLFLWFCYFSWQKEKGWWIPLTIALVTFIEFFVLAGFAVKKPFEFASWIPLPSLSNVPIVGLSLLGLEHNPSLVPRQSWLDVFFYLTLFYGISVCFRWRRSLLSSAFLLRWKDLLIVSVAPATAIFFSSFLLPFLSQRFWFYQFVPKLSLFLPRIFLPLFITSVVLLFINRQQSKNKNSGKTRFVQVSLCIFFLVGWGITMKKIIDVIPQQSEFTHSQAKLVNEVLSFSKTGQSPVILPSFIWISYLTPDNLASVPLIIEQRARSARAEKTLSENVEAQTVCQNLPETVVFSEFVFFTISSFYQRIDTRLSTCCVEVPFPGAEKAWQCGE
jgi:hypothetical protein